MAAWTTENGQAFLSSLPSCKFYDYKDNDAKVPLNSYADYMNEMLRLIKPAQSTNGDNQKSDQQELAEAK